MTRKLPQPVYLMLMAHWKRFISAVHTTSEEYSEAVPLYGEISVK